MPSFPSAPSLASALLPKSNGLNAVRLVLAIGVIFWHSYPLSGSVDPADPVRQLLSNMFVDGFFAISGYLIVSSWVRTPNWWKFLRARILRILPAFWVCLILTAAIFAPLASLLQGTGYSTASLHSSGWYFADNFFLKSNTFGIAGTLDHVPYPGVWNGSLWTLWWEFSCYLGVLVLGITRLLRRRWTTAVLFVVAVSALVAVTTHKTGNYYLNTAPRFAVMFLAGALIFQFHDKIRASWGLVAACLALTIVASFLPDYRVLAALPWAYAAIVAGALIRAPWARLPNDVSYGTYLYAFPVQQLIVAAGGDRLGSFGLFLVATALTLPIAAGSWFCIERPALRLKSFSRGSRTDTVSTATSAITTIQPDLGAEPSTPARSEPATIPID